jgi:hypothetical protein
MRLALAFLATAACIPNTRFLATLTPAAPQAPAAQAEAAPAPAPEVDTRNAGQVVVDGLVSQGYTCEAEANDWKCVPTDGNNWPMYVGYYPQEDGSTNISFVSFSERRFGKSCAHFRIALNDLADAGDSFSASCDDTAHHIQFTTTFGYGADVGQWVTNHLDHRARAFHQLESIHAIASN